jgi:hypothetical protein
MSNLINRISDACIYSSSFNEREDLILALNDPNEIEWEERIGGYMEGIKTSFDIKTLALLNRHLQSSNLPNLLEFAEEKGFGYKWLHENDFIKLTKDAEYSQNFSNKFVQDTVSVIYVVKNSNLSGSIEFKNKDIKISPEEGTSIILSSFTDYEYVVTNSEDNDFILAISYNEKL